LNFNLILNYDWSRLNDFVPMPLVILCKSEAIAPDDDSILQKHVISNLASLAHNGVSVRKESVSDPRSPIEDNVRKKSCALSNDNIIPDHYVWADMRTLTYSR
jgi:hypothetical protein